MRSTVVGIVTCKAQETASVPSEERAEPRGIFRSDVPNSAEHGTTSFERLHMVLNQSEPLPEQIARHIATFLATGSMRPSERIPTVEAAARHVGVARRTMQLAYLLLQRHGLLTSSPQRGTYCTANAEHAARRFLLSDKASALIHYGDALKLRGEEMLGVFLAALQRFEEDRPGEQTSEEPER